MALTKDQILAVDDLKRVEVAVPEWGGTVWVRTLTGGECNTLFASVARKGVKADDETYIVQIAAMAMVDDAGARLFTNGDTENLGKKSFVALRRVFEVAQQLSGLSDESARELEGNSGDGQTDNSTFA